MLNALTGVKNGSISLSDLTTTFLNQAVGNTVGAIADLYNRWNAEPSLLRGPRPLGRS